MSKLIEIAVEIIDAINERMTEEELDVTERVMLMSYISENCKCFVESVMAHDYHNAIYGGNGTAGLSDKDKNGTCPNDVQIVSNVTEQSPNVAEIGEVTEETSTASEHSITTELREWAGFFIADESLLKSINDFADRIDEQHESVPQSTIDHMMEDE